MENKKSKQFVKYAMLNLLFLLVIPICILANSFKYTPPSNDVKKVIINYGDCKETYYDVKSLSRKDDLIIIELNNGDKIITDYKNIVIYY